VREVGLVALLVLVVIGVEVGLEVEGDADDLAGEPNPMSSMIT
jgi:hypothetical protein